MNQHTLHVAHVEDGSATAGRKGVAYDWQSVLATDGVAAIEAELSDLVLESAE